MPMLLSMLCLCCLLEIKDSWFHHGGAQKVASNSMPINTLRPRQNGRHFADNTFKRIFLKKNVRISIKISLKFVPKSPIGNIPALFQLMAWHRPGDKPLSEAMMVSLLTHICVARPQWVNSQRLVLHELNLVYQPVLQVCWNMWILACSRK